MSQKIHWVDRPTIQYLIIRNICRLSLLQKRHYCKFWAYLVHRCESSVSSQMSWEHPAIFCNNQHSTRVSRQDLPHFGHPRTICQTLPIHKHWLKPANRIRCSVYIIPWNYQLLVANFYVAFLMLLVLVIKCAEVVSWWEVLLNPLTQSYFSLNKTKCATKPNKR